MLPIVFVAIGALAAVYVIWNLLQLVIGSYQDRRAVKRKSGDGAS
jgi:hypothetical protein